jgi:hypothetical protein
MPTRMPLSPSLKELPVQLRLTQHYLIQMARGFEFRLRGFFLFGFSFFFKFFINSRNEVT